MVYYTPTSLRRRKGTRNMKTITSLELYAALTRNHGRRDRMGAIYAAAYAWGAFVALYGVLRLIVGNNRTF